MDARHPLLTVLASALFACGSTPPPAARPRPEEARRVSPAAAPSVPAPPGPAAAAPPRVYLLDRVAETGIAQAYADGFAELPLAQRVLAYHLYRASIAGDRITYDQRNAHNLEVKDLLEAILGAGTATEAMVAYTKLIWINHGLHEMRSARKLVPAGFGFDELARAAHAALERGAACGPLCATALGPDAAALDARLARLRRAIFDPTFEPMCTNKSPGPGQDILTASANTFYPGLRLRDLRGFRERYPLNSRVVRRRGRLVELVYRAGGDGAEPGLYADELRGVLAHLGDAISVAPPAQRDYWGHLARYFRNGDPEEFRLYNIGWVADDPPVDAILGFVESYADARGAKGSFEGIAYYRNDGRTELMRRVARLAQYFEERTPWDPRFRRTEFRPLVAASVDVVVETGDGGPMTWGGINLPNEQAIREQHGSHNFFLDNAIEAGDHAAGEVSIREFAASAADAAEAARCGDAVGETMLVLHEITGHASGRVSPDLGVEPHVPLREHYSTLEEARADLVALWHLADPKVLELHMLPDARCVAAGYRRYASGVLAALRRYPQEPTIAEDHDRAGAMIVQFARDRGAVVAEQREGHWYLAVPDPAAFRAAVGELLTELQRIKATGDRAAIVRLVERFGAPVEASWRDDVVARARRIGLPSLWAIVSPRLVAERAADGSITDVRAERPESFQALMLEWSALERDSRARGAREGTAP